MKNEYWLVPATLIKGIQQRGITDSKYPHENVHWRLSVDEKKAIIQGNFDDRLIDWLGKQTGASKLGSYNKGKADKSVHDFVKTNNDEWETRINI